MLRIDVIAHGREETVLKMEGWLADQDVALLQQEGDARLREEKRLVLDLEGIRFIDRAGLDLLERWTKKGVTLRGGSLFVRSLLTARGLA